MKNEQLKMNRAEGHFPFTSEAFLPFHPSTLNIKP